MSDVKNMNYGLCAEREERVNELLACMSLDEKIGQMECCTPLWQQVVMFVHYNKFTYNAGENLRRGIAPIKFTDGPRGVALENATCFPVSMARGAAWDLELEERIGDAIGYEARALGANYFGGVCINVPRHPGWGRAQETYGEDTFALGEFGIAFIRALQKHVMACVKHFACNSIERSRFFVDVRIDRRNLNELYLRHFKKCADVGVASFMSAYNQLNGHFCGHSKELLTRILKEEWGYDGFVVSDFNAGIRSGEAAANAGLDIEMPISIFYGANLKRLVKTGRVAVAQIDDSARRILRQKDRFSEVWAKSGYDKSRVAGREHTRLALESARKSIVLLKNENATLPLDRAAVRRIAVIGSLAEEANLGDHGSSQVRPPYCVTPLDGIKKAAGSSVKVEYCKGDNIARARRIAKAADVVVVVCGLTWREEGEFIPLGNVGGDRMDLRLPRAQEHLIAEVAAANPRSVVVLEGGSSIIVEAWKEDVSAIMMAWYPGMEGGTAIGEIIFGDVCPSGKLPIVFPKSNSQLPYFDDRAKQIDYRGFHGYRLLHKEGNEPAFAFGFGLSYTTFTYSKGIVLHKRIKPCGRFEAAADVTNMGTVAGDEVVQLYVGYIGSSVERPLRELKGFSRVTLEPGETKRVELCVNASELAYYDAIARAWTVEEIEYIVSIGGSSRECDLIDCGTVRVKAETKKSSK